jgi:hypothetical protein
MFVKARKCGETMDWFVASGVREGILPGLVINNVEKLPLFPPAIKTLSTLLGHPAFIEEIKPAASSKGHPQGLF